MTTFLAIAELSKLDFVSYECEGKGKLEKIDGKFMVSEIILIPKVVIKDELLKEKTLRILDKSESNCLISNSMKTKITLKSEIIINK